MMKKGLVTIAGMLLFAAPAMAVEVPPGITGAAAPAYNCDYQPSCEVAPGVYGKMASPVTSKFNLSIGGFVELQYAYNSQNLGVNGYVFPGAPGGGLSPVGSNLYKEHQSEFSARTSRFWLKVAGPTFLGAKTNALIEADFLDIPASGGTPTNINENGFLRMRHAYASLDWPNTQVLFGQYSDIFGPAFAATVDFRHGATTGAPNNPRVAQVRLTQKVNFNDDNFLKLVVGVQNPVQDYVSPSSTTLANGDAPNVAAQIMFVSKALGVAPGAYGFAMNSLQAGFFGLWGNQQLNAAGVNHSDSVDVYGYGFYGFVPLVKSKDGKSRAMTASLETQGYISAGINWDGANASTNLTFLNTTATTPPSNSVVSSLYKSGSPAKGYGVYGQVIFFPTQDLGITAGYLRRNAMDYDHFTNTAATATASAITFEKYNESIYANVAYDLNAAVKLMTEYEHARTQYGRDFNLLGKVGLGDWGQANIFRVSALYFF